MNSRVFVSYSHKDRKWLTRLLTAMNPLFRSGVLTPWADTAIAAGVFWCDEITSAIASAKVAVLLVSQDFLASDFIQQIELPLLLKAVEDKSLQVFWIPITATLYDATPLAAFQAASDPARPLDKLRAPDRNAELIRIALDIKRIVETTPLRPTEKPSNAGSAGTIGGGLSKRSSNPLPAPPNPVVGREEDIRTVEGLVRDRNRRVVTLLGPPGVGKTRLALEVARKCEDVFSGRVWFVPLAHLQDHHLLTREILLRLGMQEAGRPAIETLESHLRGRELLLLLDNFEQILEGAAVLGQIIETCPGVHFLVTSRASLRLNAEQVYGVAPLRFPSISSLPSIETALDYPAIRLFIERARARKVDFSLTTNNLPAITQICGALDGLPLAIELAAGWVNALSPHAIAKRLTLRLPFRIGGVNDLPMRSQVLRHAIDWSYELLKPEDQKTFRRLGTFTGGFTLSMAEVVVGDDSGGFDVLERIGALVDQSLVVADESDLDPRFSMLETIREYALNALDASPEGDAIHRRHARAYLALAEMSEPELRGSGQVQRLSQLELEHPNLRSALEWCQRENAVAGAIDTGGNLTFGLETGLRLTSALGPFWYIRGYFGEGRKWLTWAIDASARLRADTPLESLVSQEGSLSRWRAQASHWSGYLAYYQNDYDQAKALFAGSLDIYRRLGDRWGIALEQGALGRLAYDEGDVEAGHSLQEDSLRIFRELGDSWGTAWVIGLAVRELIASKESEAAAELLRESIALRTEIGDARGLAWSLHQLGLVNLMMGDNRECKDLFSKALQLRLTIGDRRGLASSFHDCGRLARVLGKNELAVELFALAEGILAEIGGRLPEAEQRLWNSDKADMRAALAGGFDAIWSGGVKFPFDLALTKVLAL